MVVPNIGGSFSVYIFGLTLVWRAAAQTSTVNCTTALWTFNEKNQSPCEVGAALEVACTGGMLNVPPLQIGEGYSGPLAGESTSCFCSSVTFSMLSACGACQGGSVLPWNLWIQNCSSTDIFISKYPLTIPLNVSVPSWAYINVSVSGVWDPSAAETNQSSGAPDSSAGMPTSTSAVAPTTSTSSSTSSHSSNPQVGAIAGGVVGGVVGALLLILTGYFLYRRRTHSPRRAQADQFQLDDEIRGFGGESMPEKRIPPVDYISVPTPPRLYNPSDPSTFPPTPYSAVPPYASSNHQDSELISPTFTGLFTPTSGSHSLISDHYGRNPPSGTGDHGRNLSGGTTISSVLQGQVGYTGAPEI